MRTLIAVLLSVFCLLSSAFAQTQMTFSSYSTGDDGNDGLTTATAWKFVPGMSAFTGSYTHHAGDTNVIKGGDVYPHANSVIDIPGNTTVQTNGSWGTGPATLDAESMLFPGSGETFIFCSGDNITINGFELVHQYWDHTRQAFGLCAINAGDHTNIHVLNPYIHSWSHEIGNGCSDVWVGILGTTLDKNPGCYALNCIFDGYPNGTDSGTATYCFPIVSNSIARNMRSGFLNNGDPCIVANSIVGPLNTSFSGSHGAGFEPQGDVGAQYCINNIFFGCQEVAINIGGAAGPTGEAWIYNNIVYDGPKGALLNWFTGAANKAHVWNNIFDISSAPDYAIFSNLGTWTTVDAQNNIVIGTTGFDITSSGGNVDHNLFYATYADATAAGFVTTNYFTLNASFPNVGTGTDAPSSVFTSSLNGVTRGASWDIGAYQLAGAPASPVVLTLNAGTSGLILNAGTTGLNLQAQ